MNERTFTRSRTRPYKWNRGKMPSLELGVPGAFDDAHLLAPFVAYEDGGYTMWYSGSRNISAEDRMYGLGAATSSTGDRFQRVQPTPVFEWHEPGGSILTPCLLRNADGSVLREHGHLRMWFSVTYFARSGAPHTLHHATSEDGLTWSSPSGMLLYEAYSPTVIKDGDRYRMWFVDVTEHPWTIEYAESDDGLEWVKGEPPVFAPERGYDYRNYPFVTIVNGEYQMWFSYVIQAKPYKSVAIGFAHSTDGIHWTESPDNPQLTPTTDHDWESQYCGSPCIATRPDGEDRLFYASRNLSLPDHKYYAICTGHPARRREASA